ncbi:uncharacterized protein LOC103513735 [Diaphorina citri]|uniref:Uncharacterized protein LOC103513735 n=1 Tax=Diaphorina citri TaxID=121845 RepID=A0A1S4EH04_DIACI|nr:uncharacterized protein LOC103513735 [Diaphorina citri]
MPKMLEKTKQLIGLGEEEEEEGTAFADGRGKKEKKKKSFILLAAMMVKGTMIALLFKALALLAGKALVVSKIALTLSVLIAIKKLFSAPPPEKTTYEIVKTPIVTHSHEYSHSGYSGGDEGYGRSLEKEELEKRQILAKGIYPPVTPPRYRYEKYEPVPEITSKVPFFYINEAEVADTDTVDGFERDFQSNLNNNDIDGSALENKWSPKLSETVEPIRNTNNNNRQMYNPYGYRSSRVMKQPVVKTESQPIKTVEPIAKTTESPKPSEASKGAYNSFRSSRVMKAVSSENVLPEGTASKVDIVTPSAGSETRKETSQKK